MLYSDWLQYRLKTSISHKLKTIAKDLLTKNMDTFWNENRKLLCQFLKIGAYQDVKDKEEVQDDTEDDSYNNQFPVQIMHDPYNPINIVGFVIKKPNP